MYYEITSGGLTKVTKLDGDARMSVFVDHLAKVREEHKKQIDTQRKDAIVDAICGIIEDKHKKQ